MTDTVLENGQFEELQKKCCTYVQRGKNKKVPIV